MDPVTVPALYGQVVRQGIYRWFADRVWAGDAALATALLLGVASFRGIDGSVDVGYSVLAVLPLYLRRSYPEFVLVASVLIELLILGAVGQPVTGSVTALFVIYASVVYIDGRLWGRLAFGAGLLGAVLAPFVWLQSVSYTEMFTAIALLVAVVTVAFIAGDRRRADKEFRTAELAALTERTRLLTIDRDQRAQFAAAAERTRIARELHDIVAHSLAVIVVQADGGAAAAAKNPAIAEPVLRTIAETSRQALDEMRALVGVLRAEARADDGGDFRPQPGLAGLARLVEQTRQAGVAVDVSLPDPLPALTPTLDLTVYRLVQEGLTNVLKHAGPAATAQIEIAVQDGEVAVEVVDDGRGAAALSDGAGNGIQGMRERVAVLDGALWAGPRPGGGFRLRVVLPLGRPAASGPGAAWRSP